MKRSARSRIDRRKQPRRRLVRDLRPQTLEPRLLLAVDYGDAPDLGIGQAAGDYSTLLVDGGASHTIVAGVHLGAAVDGESGNLQNADANADDIDSALPKDEDGVVALQELMATEGAVPTVALTATNTSAVDATLAGWIDYDQDGSFELSERATINVPAGSNADRFTLTFPVVPDGASGETYARFRLSTDAAFTSNPTESGLVSDGEVEDYRFSIASVSTVPLTENTSLYDGASGIPGGTITNGTFGSATAAAGDLDGDGVGDMWVTAGESIYSVLLNTDGSAKGITELAFTAPGNFYRDSIAGIGDLDGDGVDDLAVGVTGDFNNNQGEGAVHIVFMNANETVKSSVKITDGLAGLPFDLLNNGDHFGSSIASVGDIDGDGVNDIVAGAPDAEPGSGTINQAFGAAFVLMLNSDGTVKDHVRISDGLAGFSPIDGVAEFESLGSSVAGLGDLDGDGVPDIVLGAEQARVTSSDPLGDGGFYTLLMNSDGSVKSHVKVTDGVGGFDPLSLEWLDRFGHSIANAGDVNGDGVNDLIVGANRQTNVKGNDGVVYALLMNSDGTVLDHREISDGNGGFAPTDNPEKIGSAITNLGDLDGDGAPEFALSATDSDSLTGFEPGMVYMTSLSPVTSVLVTNTNDGGAGSLREAITQANASPEVEHIQFDFSTSGPHVISLASQLPTITDSVIIDGTSVPSYTSSPVLQLDGGGNVSTGLLLSGTSSVVKGLSITNFTHAGIFVSGGSNHLIEDNYLGLNPAGDSAGNYHGLKVVNSTANLIDGNVLSGNNRAGAFINSALSIGNTFVNNYIGTDPTGSSARPNATDGLTVKAANNFIGLPGNGNVISGNSRWGIFTNVAGRGGNQIQANVIGLDRTASTPVPNVIGVHLQNESNDIGGDDAEAEGNTISGNSAFGIAISTTNGNENQVYGNIVGTNDSDDLGIGNGVAGVRITQGSDNSIGLAIEGNLISGNHTGVLLAFAGTTDNAIVANKIGTNANGNAAVPNSGDGVRIVQGATENSIRDNQIAGNGGRGVSIVGADAVMNSIHGNKIGTHKSGGAPIHNGTGGAIRITSPNTEISDNVISSPDIGVLVFQSQSTGTVIQDNSIGTNSAGTANIGMDVGIKIVSGASGALIDGNTIAHNAKGVVLSGSGGNNTITENSFLGNTSIGIDLGDDGTTANDPGDSDIGDNDLLNTPVVANAVVVGNDLQITYASNSARSIVNFPLKVEFFATEDNQARVFLGSDTYSSADRSAGNKTITLNNAALSLLATDMLTATFTDSDGNTSELSLQALIS